MGVIVNSSLFLNPLSQHSPRLHFHYQILSHLSVPHKHLSNPFHPIAGHTGDPTATAFAHLWLPPRPNCPCCFYLVVSSCLNTYHFTHLTPSSSWCHCQRFKNSNYKSNVYIHCRKFKNYTQHKEENLKIPQLHLPEVTTDFLKISLKATQGRCLNSDCRNDWLYCNYSLTWLV